MERLTVNCDKCGTENSDAAKFCIECGNFLMKRCPNCQTANQKSATFCSECGQKLVHRCPDCGFTNMLQQKFCGNCHRQLLENRPEDQDPEGRDTRDESARVVEPDVEAPAYRQIPQTEEAATEKVSEKKAILQTLSQEDAARLSNLDQFALISIELMNLPQLVQSVNNPVLAEHYRLECIHFIEQRTLATNGRVESVKKNILFVAFPFADSVQDSVITATEMALGLLRETLRLQEHVLTLRVGLGIELTSDRSAMTSVTERSIAKEGMLVASESAVEYLEKVFSMEAIGPLRIGQRMMTFYQVLRSRPNILPEEEALLGISRKENAVESAALQAFDAAASPLEEEALDGDLTGRYLTLYARYQTAYLTHGPLRAPNFNYEQGVETLISEFSQVFAAGEGGISRGKILFLSASPGLGKSYIIQYVRTQVDPDQQNAKAFWLGAHNYPSVSSDYFPLSYWYELVLNFLGIPREGLPKTEAETLLRNFLYYLYSENSNGVPEEIEAFLRDFLLIRELPPISVESRENLGRLVDYFYDFFKALAAQKPVVIILEDMEAMDEASFDLWFSLLNMRLLDYPVYFVVTLPRDIYLAETFSQQLPMLPHRELVISDLNHAEMARFLTVGPLAGHMDVLPPALLERILHNARGSSLYLLECLRLLHSENVLALDTETQKLNFQYTGGNVANLSIPASLEEVIQARLTHLSGTARYLLQIASVLGERFSVSMLMQIAQSPAEEFNPLLEELWNQGFITPDMANSARFSHSLIWQMVYRNVPPELLKKVHGLVSEMLEYAWHQQYAVHPSMIAFHAEQSGRFEKAIQAWHLAGIYALQIGSLPALNQCWFHTLQLVPAVGDMQDFETGLLEQLGLFNLESIPDLALPLLYQVVLHARQLGHEAKQLEALNYLGMAYERKGNFQKSLSLQDQALSLISKQQNPAEYATLMVGKLSTLFTLGRLQQAKVLQEREIEPFFTSVADFPEINLKSPIYLNTYLNARRVKANIELLQCDQAAYRTLDECLGFAQENDLLELIITLKLLRCQSFLAKGSYTSCGQSLQSILQEIEALGRPEALLIQWALIAMAYHFEMGDWQNASLLIPNALYQAEQIHDPVSRIWVNLYAARATLGNDNIREAKNLLEMGIQESSDAKLVGCALLGWRFLAEAELAAGHDAVAQEIAFRALEIAKKPEIRNQSEVFQLSILYAEALIRQGHIKPAGKLMENQWPEVMKAGFGPLIAKTAAQIGTLYQTMAAGKQEILAQKYLGRSHAFFEKARGIWLDFQNPYQMKLVEERLAAGREN